MNKWIPNAARACALLAGAVIGASAFAMTNFGSPVAVLNGVPTLLVQYDGGKASKVELRVNSATAAEHTANASLEKGEVGFAVDFDVFQHGDNVIEAVLIGQDGKVLGVHELELFAQQNESMPVFIRFPKMGETVQGTIEIQVGFGMQMRDTFVSFFVNNEFRSMRNFPPYTFFWDTTKEANGWHQVEVWAFDATQTTRKSLPIRVLINNPGGRTDRVGEPPVVSGPGVNPPVGQAGEMRTAQPGSQGRIEATAPNMPLLAIATLLPPMGEAASEKSIVSNAYAEMSGFRVAAPGTNDPVPPRVSPTVSSAAGSTAVAVTTAPPTTKEPGASAAPIKVEEGVKLPSGTYPIFLNGMIVAFDVQPRVEEGIALTPFRHLYEHAGGKVDWDHLQKVCIATGLGSEVWVKIGDLFARIDGQPVQLEAVPFIERGRTIVPLSFILGTLPVEIEYDPGTGHVLITSREEK